MSNHSFFYGDMVSLRLLFYCFHPKKYTSEKNHLTMSAAKPYHHNEVRNTPSFLQPL